MTTIRILLVDDHAVVRSGLSKFLMVNKDLELVAEASDGAEAGPDGRFAQTGCHPDGSDDAGHGWRHCHP